MDLLSNEERAAASAVASLSGGFGKRIRDDSPDAGGGGKSARVEEWVPDPVAGPLLPPDEPEPMQIVAKPYPFFLYNDFSTEADPDSLTPLTPPGRVPNFPAKMHSILSRPDLADVVCWMAHGRSWRVLKPREFEIRVIPTYFEHTKFSSFIRQANGWGFRRVTQGRDRNSYYHELFLRGLPHLCKKMKRPGVSEKQAADPDHEPDLFKISETHPVPDKSEDESILLQCTLQGGPKARMPIYSGSLLKTSFADSYPAAAGVTAAPASLLTPRDQEALSAFQQSLGASENQFRNLALSAPPPVPQPVVLSASTYAAIAQPPPILPANSVAAGPNKLSTLAAANKLAFANPNFAAAFQVTSAASQFAAGFAAATALTQHQFKSMLDSLARGMPPPQHPPPENP
jgi:hypothetical protein